ncbi:MAG: T9SS type A sorting domain-containing protein [Bacteroidales bacterium]|nr:MAG: T9SS type A sorting domain-containing protein [Bacteroidales bacterium]
MKNSYLFKKLLLVTVYVAIAGFINSAAQEVITPSASYFETPSMSLTWTIGEIAIETFTSEDIMLTQGFNQADIIITGITEELSPGFNIAIYPNPVKDNFNITIEAEQMQELKAELYSMSGTKLLSELIITGNTQINTERLPSAAYILKIYDNLDVIKSFKVIKTD